MSPDEAIAAAVDCLRRGDVVAFPTETVYGLGADASNAEAVAKIFAIKGRPASNPVIVHVADTESARRYSGEWPRMAEQLAEAFWPGPLTLVLPRGSQIATAVSAGGNTVGLRAPAHPLAQRLLRAFDGPLAAPSANRSNRVSPTTAAHVRQELGEKVRCILDGGPCRVGIESTVLDLSGAMPRVLRPGAISREAIGRVLDVAVEQSASAADAGIARSPGQLQVHYSPTKPAFRLEPSALSVLAAARSAHPNSVWLNFSPGFGSGVARLIEMPSTVDDCARRLYSALREADESDAQTIFVVMPPAQAQWEAVRDRLSRATRPWPPSDRLG